MKKREIELINERYNQRLAKFGPGIETLNSGTRERQELRFSIMTGIGDLQGTEVLDIGCGFGDFYGYLKKLGINCSYTGYDINPQLLEIAANSHKTGKFSVVDIQEESFPQFDYIVAVSTFNNKLEQNYSHIQDILERLFKHARRGVAVDFMSSYVDYRYDDVFYYEPEKIFSFCKTLTKRVCLRHDYPLFEFTVYLYPDFQPDWSENSVHRL